MHSRSGRSVTSATTPHTSRRWRSTPDIVRCWPQRWTLPEAARVFSSSLEPAYVGVGADRLRRSTIRSAIRGSSIGAVTGRIFLVGRRGLQVTVLDRDSGTVVAMVRDTLSNANRWVYQARISPDEKRAYVSYHGGMNWVDLATGAHCIAVNPGERFHYGCNSDVHAAFDFIGDSIVAADGVGVQVLDANGVMKASLDIGLIDDYALPPHFMDIGVDPHHPIVFGTMMCSYGHGVAAIAIAAARPHASLVSSACGNRLKFSEDATTLMVLNYSPGQLDLAGREPGGLTARIMLLPADDRLVDVIAVRSDHP